MTERTPQPTALGTPTPAQLVPLPRSVSLAAAHSQHTGAIPAAGIAQVHHSLGARLPHPPTLEAQQRLMSEGTLWEPAAGLVGTAQGVQPAMAALRWLQGTDTACSSTASR